MSKKILKNKSLFKVLLGTGAVTLATGAALGVALPIVNSINTNNIENHNVNDQYNEKQLKLNALGYLSKQTLKAIAINTEIESTEGSFTKLSQMVMEEIYSEKLSGTKAKWLCNIAGQTIFAIAKDSSYVLDQSAFLAYAIECIVDPTISDIKAEALGYLFMPFPLSILKNSTRIEAIFSMIKSTVDLIKENDESVAIGLGIAVGGGDDFFLESENDILIGEGAIIAMTNFNDDQISIVTDALKNHCFKQIIASKNYDKAKALGTLGAWMCSGLKTNHTEGTMEALFDVVDTEMKIINENKYSLAKTEALTKTFVSSIDAISRHDPTSSETEQQVVKQIYFITKYLYDSIISTETTDIQAEAIGYIGNAAAASISIQPEAEAKIFEKTQRGVSLIRSCDNYNAIGYGIALGGNIKPYYVGEDGLILNGALIGIARQPEAEGKIKGTLELCYTFISRSNSREKAIGIGLLTGYASSAIARQPEAEGKIRGTMLKALLAAIPNDVTPAQGYAICHIACPTVEGIGRQPEAEGKIRETMLYSINHILLETDCDEKALAIGQATYSGLDGIARQPEAEEKISDSIKNAIMLIVNSDKKVSPAIGLFTGGVNEATMLGYLGYGDEGAGSAIARQPEAEGKINRILSDFIYPSAAYANDNDLSVVLGTMGAAWAGAIGRQPEAERLFVAYGMWAIHFMETHLNK